MPKPSSPTRPAPRRQRAARRKVEPSPRGESAVVFRALLDELRQGVCMFDSAGRLAMFNRRYAELYRIAPEDLRIGMSLHDVLALRAAAGTASEMTLDRYAVWRAEIAADHRVCETVVRLCDGRSMEIHYQPTPEDGWVATHEDITARLSIDASLRAKTALLDVTLESMDQGLMMIDAEGVVRVCNERAMELLGLPAELLKQAPSFEHVRRQLLDRGVFRPRELERRRHDGQAETYERERLDGTVLEIRTVPLADGGEVRTYTDITARKQAERRVQASEERLRALTDALPQMVWVARGEDGATVYTNQRFRDYMGADSHLREARIAAHHPDGRQQVIREWSRAVSERRTFDIEARWRSHDGTYRWHKLVIAPVHHEGELVEWLGTALDIDDIVTAREALRVSEERLGLALDAGSDGLWDCDLGTGQAWSSDRGWRVLGYGPGERISDTKMWLGLLHPEDRDRSRHLLIEHLKGHSPLYESEHRLRHKDGGWIWVLVRGKVVRRGEDGTALRFVGTHVDISARKRAEAQVAHMARHDALTDLPNRTLFRERLDQKLAEIRRHGGAGAVLCLDLDRFKAINDTLGHLAGDTLLREVAARLKALLRVEDTVARLGGDEFAILLCHAARPDQVAALVERLIAAVGMPLAFGGQQMEVGVSVGIALVPEHGRDGESAFKRADLALYRAKAEGRNTFRFFEHAMDEAAAERRELERDLRRAITRDELVLHYQPQVSGTTGELVGFEALVRWAHPRRGLIAPSVFIPLAEEAGSIGALGEWVLRQACRQAAGWARPLKVAVNLSPRQFQQADLPERVLAILTEAGLSPERLELEITESVIINDMCRALTILRRLKSFGIRIAMDDFGTGYSSLATLQAFPFDKIKIDRSFVGKLNESPQAAVIVRAVLGLGRSLGMGVVAEGVETPEQLRFLTDESCDEIQGYLTGRPQPIETFPETMSAADAPAVARQAEDRPEAAA